MRAGVARHSSRLAADPNDLSESKTDLKIGGRVLPVSNLGKVLYPKVGFTKGQVLDYYIRIAPVLLPHLKNRPVTLKRYPEGVNGFFFYEKKCPAHRPDWIDTAEVIGSESGATNFCLMNDLPALVWSAQLANLELHVTLAKAPNVERPTAMVFDLDPGPPADVLACAEVGLLLKSLLEHFDLESFIKTSGSKGLQLYVPINKPTSYDIVKPFALSLAERLEREHPKLIVSKMTKALRGGKVFIDWSQNSRHKTTVCVYSLRGKERPTVSTPVTWDEVQTALKKKKPELLVFESSDVLERVGRKGDLFESVLKLKQTIPRKI
jgi:bifunctional non-homologous end joining protein LigD